MKRISNWLKQNPMLKLASLLLAFLIWITVVNFSNPEVTDYVNVELEVRNAEELTSADQMYSLDALCLVPRSLLMVMFSERGR